MADTAAFIPLGTIPSGSTFSGLGVSANHHVAGFGYFDDYQHSFVWSADAGAVDLGPGIGRAISPDGSVIVGAIDDLINGIALAFRYTEMTGVQSLGALPGGINSGAFDVSSDGAVVVGVSQSALSTGIIGEPFIWTEASGMVGLGGLPGVSYLDGAATAVTADGQVVAGIIYSSQGTGGYVGFLWSQEFGMRALPDLPGGRQDGGASGISADGSTIVGYGTDSAGNVLAVCWTEEGVESLGDIPGGALGSYASAVSSDGHIIVGLGSTDGPGGGAAIWDITHGMRSVYDVLAIDFGLQEVVGWRLLKADAISPDGQWVSGQGINTQGNSEAWLAFIPRSDLPCIGDTNGDRVVDLSDLALLLSQFGEQMGGLQGDLNSDGIVDLQDLATLLAVFGTTCP